MFKCGCFCMFSTIALAVAQPVKQGNSHQLCFSLGQGAWEAVPVHLLVQQDLSPAGGLPAVPVPGWAMALPRGLPGTQEPLDPELLRMATISALRDALGPSSH